jgi:hypothetical protein
MYIEKMPVKGQSFNRFIKDFDIFGHKINLNFDQKGEIHKTYCGGCFSLLFKLLFIIFAIIQVYAIHSGRRSVLSSMPYPVNLETTGDISLGKEEVGIFLLI